VEFTNLVVELINCRRYGEILEILAIETCVRECGVIWNAILHWSGLDTQPPSQSPVLSLTSKTMRNLPEEQTLNTINTSWQFCSISNCNLDEKNVCYTPGFRILEQGRPSAMNLFVQQITALLHVDINSLALVGNGIIINIDSKWHRS
jgi:hypothetical protein